MAASDELPVVCQVASLFFVWCNQVSGTAALSHERMVVSSRSIAPTCVCTNLKKTR